MTSKSTETRGDTATATILSTASELVVEAGLTGFSMDEVARRSRVSKSTIYKRWASKYDLIFDVCTQLSVARSTPDTGSVLTDLEIVMSELCLFLSSDDSPRVAALADGAERDPALSRLVADVASNARVHLVGALAKGIERGELETSPDPDQLADLLVGPLFYRRFFRRLPVEPHDAGCIIHTVLGPHLRTDSPTDPALPAS